MRILALETTDTAGGVAALDGRKLLTWNDLEPQQRSAKALAPAIRNLWKEVGWKPTDTQLIAVAIGPGSFTGLRVGIATAKTLAYALKCEVLGVNTLHAIASGIEQPIERLSVWMDAQREQVFAATFHCTPGQIPEWIEPARILDNATAIAQLQAGEKVAGPVLKKLGQQLPENVTSIDPSLWLPTATVIGQLAIQLYESGQRDDVWKLAPLYLRQSAAEEKWAKQTSLTSGTPPLP